MNHQDCRCELLAGSEVGHVTICESCGQVHLTLQYMTLRFEAGAFRALAEMVGRAQNRLNCATTDATMVPVPVAAASVVLSKSLN